MQSVRGVALGSLDNTGNWLSELNRLYMLGQDSNTCNTCRYMAKNYITHLHIDVKMFNCGFRIQCGRSTCCRGSPTLGEGMAAVICDRL